MANDVATANQLFFEASKLPTNHVTVYCDRAEVKKEIKAKLKSGPNELTVKKLSRSLDNDSIRVEGYGKATITEVKFQERPVMKDEEVKDKEMDLHNRLKHLQKEKKLLDQNMERHSKQKEILNGIANQLGQVSCQQGDSTIKDKVSPLISDDQALQNLDKFLTYYESRTEQFDGNLNKLKDKSETIDEEISVIQDSLSNAYETSHYFVKEVTIFVLATEAVEVRLDLFYVVSSASWSPTYDIRVQTDENSMKITYYGLIQQDTDEDWIDSKLTLSTATPMIGGQVPELHTTKVSFYKPPIVRPCQTGPLAGVARAGFAFDSERNAFATNLKIEEAPLALSYAQAAVKENVTSAAFEIENVTTIPSDSASHKVTIAIIDLKPTFEYESVPSKSPYAYYKAKASNVSPYPLLAGPTAIFVNNNFVANACLKSTNANETFDVSLGVDPTLKIEYKAAKKFNEESGLLTKSSIMTHEQRICLNNTKNDSIKLTVVEPLPQSTEERLKVCLIDPVLNRNEKSATILINKQNNVEWQLKLTGKEKRDLILKYQIEYPKGEQLDYYCTEE